MPCKTGQEGRIQPKTAQWPENDRERLLSISFWNTKEDAERYHREQYSRIVDTLKPVLKKDPKVETFNVDTSTSQRIAASRAA